MASALFSGCAMDELEDNRDTEYGYVQFKLYKEASYSPTTKALTSVLDNLSDASKIEVSMESSEGQDLIQTLTLSAADKELAEYGMRSSKLRVLAGNYRVLSYRLFDGTDDELYHGSAGANTDFTVVPGGLTVHDLTANAVEKGFVRFRIIKDLSGFNPPGTRASSRTEYTFDKIDSVYIEVRATGGSAQTEFFGLKVDYAQHFASEDIEGNPVEGNDKEPGYITSSAICDSLIRINGGTYQIFSFETFDENGSLLERCEYGQDARPEFTVSDNEEVTADVKVSLVEADAYIKDYYALRAIWESLGGPDWSYKGQTYTTGCNWNFDKDPDLWGDQPGVELHPNGRVAKIDMAAFGISGKVPAEIGNLEELTELHLGSHSEQSRFWTIDPVSGAPVDASDEEKQQYRMKRHRAFVDAMHPKVQTTAPIALALREHNISIGATSAYEAYTKDQIASMGAKDEIPRPISDITTFDLNTGVLTNNLTGIDPAIGNLSNLEILFIGNSPITADGIPEEISKLDNCTDLEIYNCPYLGRLPDGVKGMANLIQVNISNNNLGKDDDSDTNEGYQALFDLATGDSKDKIQMVYALYNNIRSIPTAQMAAMEKLGLIDLSHNSIHGTIPAFGETFSPIEVYFDNNEIDGFENPGDGGSFWRVDDMDVFSATYNKLTEFPNVFTSNTDYSLVDITLAYNSISKFPEHFNGLRTETLTLSGNKFTAFPKELFGTPGKNTLVSYLLLNANCMSEFPEDCFTSKYATSLVSMDLSYNDLSELPEDFNAEAFPYLYGVELSYNNFDHIPVGPLNSSSLTVFGMRGQRDENGERCLTDWYEGITEHTGLRALYLGSNDLRVVDDNISYLTYYLDISDNPNITFNAEDICYYWQSGVYILFYDKDQNIINCDAMLE